LSLKFLNLDYIKKTASILKRSFFDKNFTLTKKVSYKFNFIYLRNQNLATENMSQKILLDSKEVNIILHRLACQLIENHLDFSNTILIGLQPRGVFLAERIKALLETDYKIENVALGYLDITFFRDDFRRTEKPLEANKTKIDFIVENKKVVFIDDVLFTGRSIRAALTAIQSFGRPAEIELLVLIDRRFSRHLPIQPDYRGRQVDAINNEKVQVNWKEQNGEDGVFLTQNSEIK
jgi:pyrimidine operon attenuation protein/uracil phosphoribosyltransferase